MDERRPAKGSLQNVSADLPPFRLKSLYDFRRGGRSVFSEPPDDPLGLLAIGFPLVAPS